MVKDILFGSIPQTSTPGSFDVNDFKSTLRHLAVVAAGMVVVGVLDFLIKWLSGANLGQYQLIATFLISSGALEAGRNWVANHLQ